MSRIDRYGFKAIRALLLVSLFVIGLAASMSAPAFAGSSGTWAMTGKMNTARENHTATLLQNGQVLVAGGLNDTGVIAGAELYTPSQGQWTVTGSMNAIRAGHRAVLLQNGQVLVMGGSGNTGWGRLIHTSGGTLGIRASSSCSISQLIFL